MIKQGYLFLFKKNCVTTVLLILSALLLLVESNDSFIEKYYSNGLYYYISYLLRGITSWVPFSVGDILYVLLILVVTRWFFVFTKKVFFEPNRTKVVLTGLLRILHFAILLFILFKFLWGLNYYRQSILQQMQLPKNTYTKEQLCIFTDKFIAEANIYRSQIKDTSLPQLDINTIFGETEKAYGIVGDKYSFLKVKYFKIKPSVFSVAGNYFGYTGYYNPFTGEAQVRNDIPSILLPFVCSHEVAHQLGYASEDEASFVAFLVAEHSNNIYFKYSMCLEIVDYALNELILLYYNDDDIRNGLNKRYQLEDCFSKQVKKDRKTIRAFFKKNKKDFSNISSHIYDKYLKTNNQALGINSYSKVVGLIFNYFIKKS